MFDKYQLGILLIILMVTILITEGIHLGEEYHTNIFHGWEKYRFGDCIRLPRNSYLENYHKQKFPNSIATKYMNKTTIPNDKNVLYEILKTYKNNTSSDILVVHLRVGDVLELKENIHHNHLLYNNNNDKYPIIIDNIKKTNPDINKVILVGGSHKNLNNYKESKKYINEIETLFKSKGFSVERRFGNNPDEDFVYMSNAKHFVRCGKWGGFSMLVSEMVKKNGGIVYE